MKHISPLGGSWNFLACFSDDIADGATKTFAEFLDANHFAKSYLEIIEPLYNAAVEKQNLLIVPHLF